MVGDDVINVQGLEDVDDLGVTDPAVGQNQVVSNGPHEQLWVLPDVANAAADFGGLNLLHVHAIESDAAGSRCIQAGHQTKQGALATANPSQHGHLLPGFYRQRQLLDDCNFVLAGIGELQRVSLQATLNTLRDQVVAAVRAVAWPFHQTVQRFKRGGCLLVTRSQ